MITPDDVRHLFELAKVEASEEELKRFPREINSILEYIEMLRQAPLGYVSQTLSFAPEHGDLRNDAAHAQSPDMVTELKNAFPSVANDYLKTKKVFGNDGE